MDCVTAAASLKKLLVAHSTAESQVSVLGRCFVLFFKLFWCLVYNIKKEKKNLFKVLFLTYEIAR